MWACRMEWVNESAGKEIILLSIAQIGDISSDRITAGAAQRHGQYDAQSQKRAEEEADAGQVLAGPPLGGEWESARVGRRLTYSILAAKLIFFQFFSYKFSFYFEMFKTQT